jgi:alkanesulfonate monooxygenase SsuD/methylene tetrahydromethanopterin reductase-like flavin-dependent oxidoreductase (luciferase family)
MPVADTWTSLAAIAHATRTLRLGPMVTPLTLDQGGPAPHPIPVWVASSTGHPRVIRRAAGCDGIFPDTHGQAPAVGDLRALRAALRQAGLPDGRPFDIALAGNARPGGSRSASTSPGSPTRA